MARRILIDNNFCFVRSKEGSTGVRWRDLHRSQFFNVVNLIQEKINKNYFEPDKFVKKYKTITIVIVCFYSIPNATHGNSPTKFSGHSRNE